MVCQIELRNKQNNIIKYCLVSDEDYEILNKYKWCLNGDDYVTAIIDNKRVRIHRYIMINILKNNIDSHTFVDHINNNRLDNRKENLRIVTPNENSRNKSKYKNSTSKYYGVIKYKDIWKANIMYNSKHLSATYSNELHAAHQYNLWVKQYNITCAKLNNIEIPIDFIDNVFKKKDNLPKGVTQYHNKYLVTFNKTYYSFNTIEEAVEKYKELLKEKEDLRIKEIKSQPILRNSNQECIIELFDKNKNKVGETIVDEEDYYKLKQYYWHLNDGGYVLAHINKKHLRMHRYLLNYDGKDVVDHINNNKLDNRKCNLRIITKKQNSMNSSSSKNSTSKYIGVTWDKERNKWIAQISIDCKNINLGRFDNEIDAAKARDIATLKYLGEFGKLNFG